MSHGNHRKKTSIGADLRAMLVPNPLLALTLIAIITIVIAIFVFGNDAPHKNAEWSDLFRTVGIGVLAAGVTGIIDHHLLFKHFEERIHESLLEAKEITATLRTLGIQNAYKPFAFSKIFSEAQSGETIHWLDTYCPLHDEFLSALEDAIQRGVSIRMMIIQPDCENARNRNFELAGTRDSGEAFYATLRAFETKMIDMARDSGGKLEIRHYSDLPCVPMYLIGNPKAAPRKAFFSLFLSRATAHCTHMEISKGEWLENMATYFDAKWRHWEPKPKEKEWDFGAR